jgi:uncharacterized protein
VAENVKAMNIEKKPFATPGPAGLMVLAFYLICLFPIATGYADPSMMVILVPLGLAGALVQFTAGIIDLRNGDTLTGNIMIGFSAFMWYGCIGSLLKAMELMPQDTAYVDGWVFLVFAIMMVGFTPAFLKMNSAASLFMITTDVFFLGAAIAWLFGSPTAWFFAGWALPCIVVTLIWQVIGAMTNIHFGKPIIPMGPPFRK